MQFQANVIAAAHVDKSTAVTLHNSEHEVLLEDVIGQLKPTGETREERYAEVGLHDPEADFGRVGVLGLRALLRSARVASRLLAEQASRPVDKRCPLVQASNETLDALCDLFDFTTGVPSVSVIQPLLLAYHRVHALALRLFVQIWTDAGASAAQPADFARVSTLVRSQIKSSVRADGRTSVIDVERDFASADYRTVRDRLSKELAVEDDLLLKAPVRSVCKVSHAQLTTQIFARTALQGVIRVRPATAHPLSARGRLVPPHRRRSACKPWSGVALLPPVRQRCAE